jgi:hypothetical protein
LLSRSQISSAIFWVNVDGRPNLQVANPISYDLFGISEPCLDSIDLLPAHNGADGGKDTGDHQENVHHHAAFPVSTT